jgi:hypothetical protein
MALGAWRRRQIPYRAAGPARVGLGLPDDDASDAGRRDRRAGRWTGLPEQIAADLLPEAGDSRAVDGGEGR